MRCSRVGCNGDAVVSYCFDGRAALVWLDLLDPARGLGAGILCRRHADTLTPPRGWHLQDRRPPAPRLWDDRPPVPPPPPLCVVDPVDGRRPTAPRTETEDEEPLPFAVGRTPDEEAQEERKAADDIDEMFVARTPLLVARVRRLGRRARRVVVLSRYGRAAGRGAPGSCCATGA